MNFQPSPGTPQGCSQWLGVALENQGQWNFYHPDFGGRSIGGHLQRVGPEFKYIVRISHKNVFFSQRMGTLG